MNNQKFFNNHYDFLIDFRHFLIATQNISIINIDISANLLTKNHFSAKIYNGYICVQAS